MRTKTRVVIAFVLMGILSNHCAVITPAQDKLGTSSIELSVDETDYQRKTQDRGSTLSTVAALRTSDDHMSRLNVMLKISNGRDLLGFDPKQTATINPLIRERHEEIEKCVMNGIDSGSIRAGIEDIRRKYAVQINGLLTEDQYDTLRYLNRFGGPRLITETIVGDALEVRPGQKALIREESIALALEMDQKLAEYRIKCSEMFNEILTEQQLELLVKFDDPRLTMGVAGVGFERLIEDFDYSTLEWRGFQGTPKMWVPIEKLNEQEFETRRVWERFSGGSRNTKVMLQQLTMPRIELMLKLPEGVRILKITPAQVVKIRRVTDAMNATDKDTRNQLDAELEQAGLLPIGLNRKYDGDVPSNEYVFAIHMLLSDNQVDALRYPQMGSLSPKLITETMVGAALEISPEKQAWIRETADELAKEMREFVALCKIKCIELLRNALTTEQFKLIGELDDTTIEAKIHATPVEKLVEQFRYSSE